MPTYNLSKKQWLGIATETTPGTLAAAPSLYIPVKAEFKNKKKRVYYNEERNTRDVNNNVSDGGRWNEGSVKGAWYNDSSAYLLKAFMGADTPTQPDIPNAPTAYSHALTLTDLPLALSMWKAYHNIVYTMAYNMVSKVKFSWEAGDSDKGIQFEADTKGLPFTKITAGIPTPTFTSVMPFSGWAPVIQLSGASTNDIEKFEIEIEQKWTLWFPSNGSPQWTDAYPGDRSAKVKFTARFDTDTLYQKYAANTGIDDQINIAVTGPLIGGTTHQSLMLNFPLVGYDDMEMKDSKENITLDVSATPRPGTAINSLFTATVVNTVASY